MSAVKKLNIVDIENGLEEISNRNLTPAEYGKELIALFSSSATLKRLGTSKANTSEFENGLLWREKIHYVPCAPGQLNATIDAVKKSDKTLKAKVRLVVVNDGSHILVYDRKYDELTDCTIDKIKDEPQLFLPLAGQEGFRREEESEVDIKATGKLAKVYDALIERNPEWLEGDKRHALNHFMTQIIFCLFAEDTGIFPKDIFTKALKNRAGSDGQNSTQVITEIFGVLDLDDHLRKDIAPWLTEFPYVNGGLFSGEALVPVFTSKAYRYLLETAALDWKHINPDILGSSIQAIVDPTMRGNLGMHYTSVPNILKTLEPLFLNEFRDELLKARHSKKQINSFLERLSQVVVFDPACGSGNFLVIAYRELRKLELQALDALRDLEGGASLAFGFSSVISLSNFYGIEYADFAAETAKLALWIAEYQQNARFIAAFGTEIPALPLSESGEVLNTNALIVEWESILNSHASMEIYIVGNPPYLGAKQLSKEQKSDLDSVFKGRVNSYKSFDYVSGWLYKGAKFCEKYNASLAFVMTNSIVQGLHASSLWPNILNEKIEISFAHKSFKWKNNAADNAGVTCVVVGVSQHSSKHKKLFDGENVKEVSRINSYLLNKPNIYIEKKNHSPFGLPDMSFGNMAYDGGALILSPEEKEKLLTESPHSQQFLKELIGSQELIRGAKRFCLWLNQDNYTEAAEIPFIRERIELCRENRLKSKDAGGVRLADTPFKFRECWETESLSIIVPRVFSENREYVTAGVINSEQIVSDSAFAIYDADLWMFSLLVSSIHLLWIKTVCGQLETRIRYSNTLGWHTFPCPSFNMAQKALLEQSAKNILLARESNFPKSIAELYNPQTMPADLKLAHEENDALVENFYFGSNDINDEDSLDILFHQYLESRQG